jgi:hypothetical protein
LVIVIPGENAFLPAIQWSIPNNFLKGVKTARRLLHPALIFGADLITISGLPPIA